MQQLEVRVTFNGLSDARGRVDDEAAETMRVDVIESVAVVASGGVQALKAAVVGIPRIAHCLEELDKVHTGVQLTAISRGQAMMDHMLYALRPGEVVYCVFTEARDTRNRPTVDDDQPHGARGFDRLLEAGFTEEEVGLMRAHFRLRSPTAGDAASAESLVLEDAWLDTDAIIESPLPAASHPTAVHSGPIAPHRSASRSSAADSDFVAPHGTRLDPTSFPPSMHTHDDDVEVEVDPVDSPYFANYYTHFLVSWIVGYFFGMVALAIDSRKSRMGSWLGIMTNIILGFCAASSVNIAKM